MGVRQRAKGLVAWGAVVASVLALAGGAAEGDPSRFARLKVGVTLGEYAYRFVRRGRVRDFVLEATVRTTAAGPAVRVLFGYQDKGNHYYAEASDTNCVFVRVEDGIERRIGTESTAQLARDAAVRLAVIRWRHTMGLWMNGRQVAEAYDGTFRSGRVALAGRKDSAAIEGLRFQVVGDVRLTDDFMRTDKEQNVWETVAGHWELRSLRDASMSANAFMFAGWDKKDGPGALAVRGYWFWHNYVVSAACRPAGDEAVGLVFYYRDPAHYHLLRWESLRKGGRLQILRVDGGTRHAVGTASVGFTQNQWYQLKVRVVGQRAAAYVDGNEMLTVADPALVSGGVGLYCEGEGGAHFDDIQVAAPRDFGEDFDREIHGKWIEYRGTWRRQPGTLSDKAAAGHMVAASAAGEARYVSGELGWNGYSAAVSLRAPPQGHAGLVAHYLDEANFYLLSVSREAAVLAKAVEGKRTELARVAHPLKPGSVHRLELGVERSVLTGRLDGRVLVRRVDGDLPRGQVGLFVRDAREAAFDDLSVTMPRRRQELFTAHDVFAAETSMAKWAVRQSDWLAATETLGGQQATVQWHRADFPADVEVEARLASLSPGGRCWIVLAADGQSTASGYRVRLERRDGAWAVVCERGAKEVARRTLSLGRPPRRFSAQRLGRAVLAHVDGRVALGYEDPHPLRGQRMAWAADRCTLVANGITLFSHTVRVYSFHKAPVDWRPASGLWEVTNRWQCDPRWSFFAGEQRADPLVALWSKRDFGSNVTVEFAAGIRHNPNRGGTSYHYASDINAVICGDGADLRKGYNFVFGGWHNRHTRILRDGKVVADTSSVLMPADSSQHRRWYYIKIQKHGGRLRLSVDNALALEYTDPEPLTGSKVALWTWNNDLMVARVRISAPQAAPCERPAAPPVGPPRCIYR